MKAACPERRVLWEFDRRWAVRGGDVIRWLRWGWVDVGLELEWDGGMVLIYLRI